MSDLTIGDVARLTGVAEGTLRMWESRHGFPVPRRLDSGHRRYGDHDVELVRRVAAERVAGVALGPAIAIALRSEQEAPRSLYAALRRQRPELEPRRLAKRTLLALTHAIEDESLARAERPLLFGCFQRERYYRQAAARWRELARPAQLAIAFADFPRPATPSDGAAEVCIGADEPLLREWAIVCDAPGHAVCLIGWEPPAAEPALDRDRVFEATWSVEPAVVRDAARICAEIAADGDPTLVDRAARSRLDGPPAQATGRQLALATAIANRALEYLG